MGIVDRLIHCNMEMMRVIMILALSGLALAGVLPREPSNNAITTVGYNLTCPSPFVLRGLYCLYWSSAEEAELNWFEASVKCRLMHPTATLARPYTSYIND